jgi:hypothetical protein
LEGDAGWGLTHRVCVCVCVRVCVGCVCARRGREQVKKRMTLDEFVRNNRCARCRSAATVHCARCRSAAPFPCALPP